LKFQAIAEKTAKNLRRLLCRTLYITKHTFALYHGLYGSTNYCISHGPSQWEMAIFDPPPLRDPSTDFHEIWNV